MLVNPAIIQLPITVFTAEISLSLTVQKRCVMVVVLVMGVDSRVGFFLCGFILLFVFFDTPALRSWQLGPSANDRVIKAVGVRKPRKPILCSFLALLFGNHFTSVFLFQLTGWR